jgi:hypothetical protein
MPWEDDRVLRTSVLARLLLVTVVMAAALLLVVEPAGACLCSMAPMPGEVVPDPDLEAFEHADVVFVGVADVVPSRPPLMDWTGNRTMTFAVGEVFKGEALADQEVVTSWSSSCGLEGIEEGEEYVVFASDAYLSSVLSEPLESGQVSVHQCQGTRRLDESTLPASFGDGGPPLPSTSTEADWDVLRLWVAGGALLSVAIATVGVTLGLRDRRR